MPERTFVGGNYRNRENPNKLPQWAIDAQNSPYILPSDPPGNRLIGGNFEGRGGQKLPAWATEAKEVENQRMIEEGLYSRMTPEQQVGYFQVDSLPLAKNNSRSRNLIDRENDYLSDETVGYMGGTFELDNGLEREIRNRQDQYVQAEKARNPQLYYERY